ncbi:Asp-tRNA(Asn)/Glu-tRNA(Gln) amidotransferase GatCAB subunit C [Rhizobium sp. L43]|nr:Asp-tRNA(Asn)/Glu-tRNA(Gln) amidotransferase GatCAB subunit C [Rhizobium sp. L43]
MGRRLCRDIATVRRIARLARLALSEDEAEKVCGELNEILTFVEQLWDVDVEGIPPMTSVQASTGVGSAAWRREHLMLSNRCGTMTRTAGSYGEARLGLIDFHHVGRRRPSL